MATFLYDADTVGYGTPVNLTGIGDKLTINPHILVHSTDSVLIRLSASSQTIDNSGILSAAGLQTIAALNNGPTHINNDDTGVIRNSNAGGVTISLNAARTTINNFGTISSRNDAIHFLDLGSSTSTINNHGLIDATYDAIVKQSNNNIHIENDGIIHALVAFFDSAHGGSTEFYNTGYVTGDIFFGDGDDIYYGSTGHHLLSSRVVGGGGRDIIVSGTDNDWIIGGTGDDILFGGAGADRMEGGAGNDVFYVDNANDTVVETSAADGIDTINASVDWLGYKGSGLIENINLTGTGNIRANGTAIANVINGNAGSNALSGGGGGDTISGGAGNDIYYIIANPAGDRLIELANQGVDTVQSLFSWTLGANFENLTLGGQVPLNGTGNALGNTITGNVAANLIIGGAGNDRLIGDAGNDRLIGGAGVDLLTGGAGYDAFFFDTAPGAGGNHDLISDFNHVQDVFQLEHTIFTRLATTNSLNPAFFHVGPAAADANDYVVYNPANGALYYDSNGSAAGGAVLLALLTTRPAIAANDFQVV